VQEWLSKKAEGEDLVHMREQIEMMPTSSGMEIRFKQLANEMKVLYETV